MKAATSEERPVMHDRFTLILQTEGRHPTPAEMRLKQLLKLALRGFGFRCVSVMGAPKEIADASHLTGAENAKGR